MGAFPLLLSFVISLVGTLPSWDRPGRRGSLQRAATARTADRKIGQNVRRHDLCGSHASMNKRKEKKKKPLFLPTLDFTASVGEG